MNFKITKKLLLVCGMLLLGISAVVYVLFFNRSFGEKISLNEADINGEALQNSGGEPTLITNELLMVPNWLFILVIMLLIIFLGFILKKKL